MDKMEECDGDAVTADDTTKQMDEDPEAEDPDRGRPSTPKWWRPPIPPETYKWEEMRRERQKGGYPWTHLDKEDEIDADDYLDENIYEPVNPPPLSGNESYLRKDLQQVPLPDEPMIDIPPELEIITSEGLDGLDKPDRMDKGFDGDREWQNVPSSEDEGHGKSALGKGKQKQKPPRPTTPKQVGFSPETITHEVPKLEEEPGDQEVPEEECDMEEVETSSCGGGHSGGHGKRQTAFDILKSKATGCADHFKQKIKSAIPVRPKASPGSLKPRRRKKAKHGGEEEEQEGGEEGEKMEEGEATEAVVEAQDVEMEKVEVQEVPEIDPAVAEAERLRKEEEEEEKRKKKEEEKIQQQKEKEERERKKAEEKAAKQKAAEEAKRLKEEEKAREAERKQKEKEERERIAAEKKKEEEARKAAEKAKKEEEARIAAEKKKEEDARRAAEKAKKVEEAKARRAEEEAKKAEEKAIKEEEARIAAEKKAEEDARIAEEKAKKLEEEGPVEEESKQEADKEEVVEEKGEGEEGQEEAMEDVAPTPSGTTKRKYIRHRRQLPQIPNPITTLRNQVEDFKNRLKRSRTPPRRKVQSKHRRSRSADASRSPPRDPEEEHEKSVEPGESQKDEEMEENAESKSTGEANEPPQTADEPETTPDTQQEKPSTGTRGRTRKQPAAKEAMDKVGQSLKVVGAKSFGIVSQATKAVGQVGKEMHKLGSKAIKEATKNRKPSQATSQDMLEVQPQEDTVSIPEPEPQPQVVAPPKRTYRFKRRNESQEEADEEEMRREEDDAHFYENAVAQNRLLGSGAKDWESPNDRAASRDVSEEPYSGNASARDSPPGSSLASSTFAPQVRRTGVLEEIDSDEFFLRERGISEGEDEEEVNRFLVEELRQAFRPTMASNALQGFDMTPIEPPPRPDRTPRKPPRKDKEEPSPSMYQTFPPERPKRKQPQGYVSKFMKEHEDEYDDELGSNEEVRGSSDEMRDDLESNEAIQVLKSKLSKIESEEEETQHEVETEIEASEEPKLDEEYEDDGKYEPISDGSSPMKPSRTKRKLPKRPPTPPSFYYNTIAANEWRRELDATEGAEPAAPVRKRRGSGKSGSSITRSEEPSISDQVPVRETEPAGAGADVEDFIDEAGYAIVQKDREVPTTIPRKKKKRGKEALVQQSMDPSRAFFSMPRPDPIVPPERPNRTYSTLRPSRPPRSKSGSRSNLERSPATVRREGEEARPSNIINLMQGRPLPPPPRPTRLPQSVNDLDQSSIEMSVGLRHYANFEDIESQRVEQVLGSGLVTEVDIACQTDPVPEDEFVVGTLTTESLLDDGSRIITASSRLERLEPRSGQSTSATAGDVSTSFQTTRSQETQSSHTPITRTFTPSPTPPFVLPTRLHLEELEVDILKVNELVTAQRIKVGHLQAGQIETNSMSATGSVCAPRIETESLQSDHIDCSKLSSEAIKLPFSESLSLFRAPSPDPDKLKEAECEQELCLKAEEKEELENESACPLELTDSMQTLMGNVDSTNELKSSVAEKVLDKQLNLSESAPASDKTTSKKDASVGTPTTPTEPVPIQLNNLNQELSTIAQTVTSQQVEPQPRPESEERESKFIEEDTDPGDEEAVVVGSYTLPYSYMPSPPTPPNRSSSLKRNRRGSDTRPKSPVASPPREEAHVAFGHTTIAQGDVLSVKLSIPVERSALPQQSTTSSSSKPKSPPAWRRPSPPPPLPDSPSEEDSRKSKESVQKPERKPEKKTPTPPPPSPPQPPAPRQAPPPPDSGDGDESFFDTSVRLGRAVIRFGLRSLQAMADYIDTAGSEDPAKAEQQRANMQVLLCLLLVLVVGLILATTRSGPYTSPRWEFLMPPPDL